MQRTMLKCPILHAHCTSIQNPEKEPKGSVSLYAMHHFRMGPVEFYQFLKKCPMTTHEYLLNLMG